MKLNYLAIPYLALFVFIFGGLLTNNGIAWYNSLLLPVWNPPTVAVALIWALIYACAAGSLFLVWNAAPRTSRLAFILAGFVFSTLLNAVWSILFFHFHLLGASVVCAAMLELSVLTLIGSTFSLSRRAALLLVPYAVWVVFAGYLQYVVMTLNS